MGFLNHATNNIIIDAVLTERGRELLANESFEITSFAFADDEVDYSLIKKYGLVIGKEKIEKNTPIFEANPNENIALKYPLITFSNPVVNLQYMPTLIWSNKTQNQDSIQLTSVSTLDQSISTAALTEYSVSIKNYVANLTSQDSLEDEITDTEFIVKVHDSLLRIRNEDFIDVDINNVATYNLTTNAAADRQWTNQIIRSFTVYSQGIITNSSFTRFGSVINPNIINTSIQVIGKDSGASLVIPVTITRQ